MSILSMILERELTPEQREARRARAKARREKAKAEKSSESVDDVLRIGDDEWALAQWEKMNKIYFNGSLKKPRGGVHWTKKMKSRGKCRNDYDYIKDEVYTLEILLSMKAFTSYTSFRNTLVHEMVHQWFYQQLGEDDIRYANRYGQARTRNWWNHLTADAGRDGHHGRWLQKAEELNAAHKELSLSKFSSEDQFEVSNSEKKARTAVANKAHVLIRTIYRFSRSKRYFYYVTDEAYQRLRKSMTDGTISGPWHEYDFDPEQMAIEIKEPDHYVGNHCYKIGYFNDLCERGIIKEWTERKVSPSDS